MSLWMSSSACQKWARKASVSVVVPGLDADQVERPRWIGRGCRLRATAAGSVESRMRTGMPRRRRPGTMAARTSGASDEPPMPHTTAASNPSSRTPRAKATSASTSIVEVRRQVEPAEAVGDHARRSRRRRSRAMGRAPTGVRPSPLAAARACIAATCFSRSAGSRRLCPATYVMRRTSSDQPLRAGDDRRRGRCPLRQAPARAWPSRACGARRAARP